MGKITISIIVAMAENGCIGMGNDLPWHIPEDLKRFKTLTLGKPVIMGRKTFESIVNRLGKPLPGRTNIVISRSPRLTPPPFERGEEGRGVIAASTIEYAIVAAKKIAADQNLDEIFIGGGSQIYELALPLTDRLYLTRVHTVINGDAFFPPFDTRQWRETEKTVLPGAPSCTFTTLERAQP